MRQLKKLMATAVLIFGSLFSINSAFAGFTCGAGKSCPDGYTCWGNICQSDNSNGLSITSSITSDGIRITDTEQFGSGFAVTSDPATGGNTLTGVPSSLDITYTITDDAGVTEGVTYQCHVSY